MAKPTTRQELIDYCLRKLGQPVINVEVAPEQCDDRIDEALATYQEKHFDASEDVWVSYPLQQTDIDNGYITIPDDILAVTNVTSLSDIASHNDMFSFRYQLAMQEMSPWRSFDMTDYTMRVMNYEHVLDTINSAPGFEYTRHGRRLHVNHDLTSLGVGYPFVVKVTRVLDPDQFTSVWNDKWLKQYATALIKRQWGENTKKFGDMQMLGGTVMNGQQIFDEAMQELEALEETLQETYQEPTNFFVG